MMLGEVDIKPEQIDTKATVNLEKGEGGFSITAVHLEVSVSAPGAAQEAVLKAAEKAKAGCPVSRVLNAEITMTAKLKS